MEKKFFLVVDHFDPGYLYFVTCTTEEEVTDIRAITGDGLVVVEPNLTGEKFARIEWNDEFILCEELGSDWGDIVKKDLIEIQEQLDHWVGDEDGYWEAYSEVSGAMWTREDMGEDFDHFPTAQEVLDRGLNWVENSYVDCDSSSAVKILDVEEETEFKGGDGTIIWMSAKELIETF